MSTQTSILRATGVVALFAIAAIHFLQIVETFEESLLLGLGYTALIAASIFVAVRLIESGDARAWAAAATLGGAVIFGYAFTRVASTALDQEDVGNWACMLGLASLFIESSLVGLAVLAMRQRTMIERLGPTAPARVRSSD